MTTKSKFGLWEPTRCANCKRMFKNSNKHNESGLCSNCYQYFVDFKTKKNLIKKISNSLRKANENGYKKGFIDGQEERWS